MSNAKRARRAAAWCAYQRRIDLLVAGQPPTHRLHHPMRTNPGYFRAEGWNTVRAGISLRHGS